MRSKKNRLVRGVRYSQGAQSPSPWSILEVIRLQARLPMKFQAGAVEWRQSYLAYHLTEKEGRKEERMEEIEIERIATPGIKDIFYN